jgi:hypothetical protein
MAKEASTESMVAGLDGLISPDKIKVVKASIADNPVAAPAAPVTPVVEAPAAVTTTIDPIIIKSPLGEQKYGGTPAADIPMNTFQDVQKFAKDFIGADLKEVKDFVPFFAKVKTLQEQASQAEGLQKVVDNYKSNLESLPKEVILILDAAVSNGDYKSVINNLQKKSALDYTKSFADHDPVALANLYTGKQYTKETFEALDEFSRSALSDSVKMKFDADRSEVLNFENNNKIAMEQRQKAYSTSIDTSISALQASNPRMDKNAVAEIKKVMQFGLSDVLFNKDKTYASDSAEKIAMMLYGKQTIDAQADAIGDLVKKTADASKTEEIQKILLRSDKPPVQTGAPATNVHAQQVSEATSWLPQRK